MPYLLRPGLLLLLGLAACAASTGGDSAAVSAGELCYLHIYSPRYPDISNRRTYGPGERATPRENHNLATIGVVSGQPIYANLPNHYEPEIRVVGRVRRNGGLFHGRIEVCVQGVDVAYLFETAQPIPLDRLVQFDQEPFYLALSDTEDPYAIAGRSVLQVRAVATSSSPPEKQPPP